MNESLVVNPKITWCPGCDNFIIANSVKEAIEDLIKSGERKENFTMVTGIGCHGKMFDFLNINGVYGLHGRVIPVASGIKVANEKLKVIGFSGDGDSYSEGISHLIHAARTNPDITLIIFNNQNFALTTGQLTSVSQKDYKNKNDLEIERPLNPLSILLSSGAGFISRANGKKLNETKEIIKKAIEHRGFSIVEIIQNCPSFNPEIKNLQDKMEYFENSEDLKKARELCEMWNYNHDAKKIPVGIFYQSKRKTMSEKLK
jgi:2-oxoglutarate/2-oxoacid ferredoxin oxidoreductase subunit beta